MPAGLDRPPLAHDRAILVVRGTLDDPERGGHLPVGRASRRAPGHPAGRSEPRSGTAKVNGVTDPSAARSSCHGPTSCHGPSGLTRLTSTSTLANRVAGSEPGGSTHSSRVTCAARSSWNPTTQWMGVPAGRYDVQGVGILREQPLDVGSGRRAAGPSRRRGRHGPGRRCSAARRDGTLPGVATTFHSPSVTAPSRAPGVGGGDATARSGPAPAPRGRTPARWRAGSSRLSGRRRRSCHRWTASSSKPRGRAARLPSPPSGSRTMPATGTGTSPARSTVNVTGAPEMVPAKPLFDTASPS